MATDAQKRAMRKYNAKMRSYSLKLNKVADADIIAAIDANGGLTQYFKKLVRSDMNGGSN